jgi:hypothetical protein
MKDLIILNIDFNLIIPKKWYSKNLKFSWKIPRRRLINKETSLSDSLSELLIYRNTSP